MAKHNVSIAAVVQKDNHILLIRGERRGWEMPGGGVEEGETLPQALVREVFEETGCKIKPISPVVVSQNQETGVVSILWLATYVCGELMPNPPESLEIAWIPVDHVERYVRYGNFAERIRATLAGMPQFLLS